MYMYLLYFNINVVIKYQINYNWQNSRNNISYYINNHQRFKVFLLDRYNQLCSNTHFKMINNNIYILNKSNKT